MSSSSWRGLGVVLLGPVETPEALDETRLRIGKEVGSVGS